MSVRTSHRITAMVGPVVAAALVLAACGGGATDAETRPTIELAAGETSFETLAPATTLSPTEVEASVETAEPTSSGYTIQSGDVPVNVASDFGTSLEELAALNGWATCVVTSCPEFPFPGETIQVPGNASPAPDEPAADDGGSTPVEGETGDAIPEPEGDACDPGSYPIEAGDFEGSVASKFDITVEELRAANAQTADYNVFYVGLELVIPARDNC